MTTQDKPPGGPALIVFGIPPGEASMRAGWFPSEQAARAEIAARSVGLLYITANTEDLQRAASSLERAELTRSGELKLHPVSSGTVSSLVLHHRTQGSGKRTDLPKEGQGSPGLATRPRTPVPRPLWDTLTVTDVVLAAHLADGEPAGWWEAVIISVRYGTYTLRWCDYPEEGLFRRQRKHIALLFPD